MAFRVGQKVVCVDASPGRTTGRTELVLNAIYTIRGFDDEDAESGIGIYLLEIPDGPIPRGWKYPNGWAPERFRPVQERKSQTDISIFVKMLNPKKVDA